MKNELLKIYDVESMQSFVYVVSEKESDLKNIENSINKKLKEYGSIKNVSFKKKELKMKIDALTAKLLSEVL